MSAKQAIQNVGTPVEIARALNPGQYRYVDRVDRRDPGTSEPAREAIEASAKKLLARADVTTDDLRVSREARAAASAKPCLDCGRPTLGSFGPAPQFNFWASLCQACKDKADAECERVSIGMAAKIDTAVRKAFGLPTKNPHESREQGGTANARPAAAFTDLGDGLPLAVIGQGEYATRIEAETFKCALCPSPVSRRGAVCNTCRNQEELEPVSSEDTDDADHNDH